MIATLIILFAVLLAACLVLTMRCARRCEDGGFVVMRKEDWPEKHRRRAF